MHNNKSVYPFTSQLNGSTLQQHTATAHCNTAWPCANSSVTWTTDHRAIRISLHLPMEWQHAATAQCNSTLQHNVAMRKLVGNIDNRSMSHSDIHSPYNWTAPHCNRTKQQYTATQCGPATHITRELVGNTLAQVRGTCASHDWYMCESDVINSCAKEPYKRAKEPYKRNDILQISLMSCA